MWHLSNEAKILTVIGIITVALLFGGVWYLNKEETKEPVIVDSSKLVKSDSYKTGDGSEKVTVVEFADFQCPGCAAAHEPIQQIAKDYKGKVNIVFRHFPLGIHSNARRSSAFAEGAGEQGKFWEAYQKLFETQTEWSVQSDIDPNLEKYAGELGLDYEKIKASMESESVKNKIQRDYDDGVSVGVAGTPTVFINGKKLEVFPTYEALKEAIDKNLNK